MRLMKLKWIQCLLLRWTCVLAALLATGARGAAQEKTTPLLVVISVDGLRPDYITEADRHGAKVPNLRRFLKEGTYACFPR